jgi:hypothetical protein
VDGQFQPDQRALRQGNKLGNRDTVCSAQDDPRRRAWRLLLFSGIELALSSRLPEHQGNDLFLVLLMAAIGVALSPAAAFAVGLPIPTASSEDG